MVTRISFLTIQDRTRTQNNSVQMHKTIIPHKGGSTDGRDGEKLQWITNSQFDFCARLFFSEDRGAHAKNRERSQRRASHNHI